MNMKTLCILLIGFALVTACASPATPLPPTPTSLALPTSTLSLITQTPPSLTLTPGAVTPLPGQTITAPTGTTSICNDPQVTALIDSFKTAVLNSDGSLLSSLVSPTRHMDVAFFRDGTVITYDPEHAKFLFETTFEVDWGTEPGSGASKIGSFHDVVVPELVKVFNQPYTLHCNELKLGGATYEADWPYEGEFYSVHFPGTAANGNMDWQTWVMGIEYVNGKPYIYALLQFFWEP
jgi:hypothetical protein